MRFFALLIGTIFLFTIALVGSLWWDAFMIQPDEDAEAVEFVVDEGASVSGIATDLEEADLISSDFFFKVYVKLTGNQSNLQAGVFELLPGASFKDLLSELVDAQAVEVEVTFPEGLTAAQIGEIVEDAFDSVVEEEWDLVSGEEGTHMLSTNDILQTIPQGQGLEGYLFPDTYRFSENASALQVADTMVLTLKRRMAENGVVIPATLVFENGMTMHELLTLASIVEREVRAPEDMKVVAGIFLTRMQIGMALQADSTVNYVTGKKDAAISLDDSKINSPYNTYQNLGLTPGPISNPGMNAIMAVLEPSDTDYLYFLTDLEGNAHYATTFDQHIENKYKYLK